MDFGFTNDKEVFDLTAAWRDAAAADGWSIRQYFPNEPVEEASKLERDGYVASILTRTKNVGKWKYEAQVNLWGPDGLSITPPKVYDWKTISGGPRRCNYCKAEDVDTERVGFAGRCCAKCLPQVRARVERPGWCD